MPMMLLRALLGQEPEGAVTGSLKLTVGHGDRCTWALTVKTGEDNDTRNIVRNIRATATVFRFEGLFFWRLKLPTTELSQRS